MCYNDRVGKFLLREKIIIIYGKENMYGKFTRAKRKNY